MTNRMKALPQPAIPFVDSGPLRNAEAGSRSLDGLLSRFRGALLATASPTMGEMILFSEGSSVLDGGARAALRHWSAVLRANPGIRVVIGGLASRVGSTTHAMGLGFQRVQAIRAFLLSQGVRPTRIEVAVRGSGWFLVERPGGAAGEDPSAECRLQIVDPQWALWRN